MTTFRALFLALLYLLAGSAQGWAAQAEIWFDPREFPGWLDMFRDDTAWKQAAARVNVLVLEPSFLATASDADILTITNYARTHGKKLAFVAQAVTRPTDRYCGGTEGYASATEMKQLGVKLKNLHVTVDYLLMDEPLWFGHYDTEPLTCLAPIPELVTLVAATVNDFASLWPDIAVVEIEPAIPVASIPGWQQDLASFLAGLERLTGKPVRTLQLDVDWHNPAASRMSARSTCSPARATGASA